MASLELTGGSSSTTLSTNCCHSMHVGDIVASARQPTSARAMSFTSGTCAASTADAEPLDADIVVVWPRALDVDAARTR